MALGKSKQLSTIVLLKYNFPPSFTSIDRVFSLTKPHRYVPNAPNAVYYCAGQALQWV